MAFTFKGTGSASTANSKTANQATLVVTTATTAGSIGNLVVVCYGVDNAATSDQDEGAVTGITDNSGGSNAWTKGAEWTNSPSATAQAGQVCGLWYCDLTTALPVGSTITLAFSSSTLRDASAANVTYFTKGAGSTVSVEGTPTNASDVTSATISALNVTTANIECVRVRAVASETGQSGSDLTKTAAFTGLLTLSTTTGNPGTTNASIRGEYLISTGTGQSSQPTEAFGAANHSSVYVAFKEVVSATITMDMWFQKFLDIINLPTEIVGY